MKKRIFITGATSFLGSSLVLVLKDSYELTVLAHRNMPTVEGVRIIKGGLENIPAWENELSEIDIMIHLAAITHSRDIGQYEKINALGTRDLVEFAKRHHVQQFIFISTRAIGANCGAYGLSKEHAEQYVQKSGLTYTTIRVGEAYDDDWSKAEGLGGMASLMHKSPIVPYLSGLHSTLAPIHKDDIRDGILATIGNEATHDKTYTLAGPENLSFKQIVQRMCAKENVKRVLIPMPIIFARVGFFILSTVLKKASPDQFQRLLGDKKPLSEDVATDLHIRPRLFLLQSK